MVSLIFFTFTTILQQFLPDNAIASLNVCNSGSGSLPGSGVGATTIFGAELSDEGELHTIILGLGELLQIY